MGDWFEAELKKMPGGLHLRRSSLRNKAAGLHPETLQVWGIGEVSRRPYLVMFLTDDAGNPRRPYVHDLNRLRGRDKARIPGIQNNNYVETTLAKIDAAAEEATEKGWRESDEFVRTEGIDSYVRKRGRRKTIRAK